MLNYIIYEDNQKMRDYYISIIHKLMGNSNEHYKIYPFDSYTPEIKNMITEDIGKKIYVLDIEVPGKSGIDLAREIRYNNDWKSQIIIVTSHDNMQNGDFRGKILMLNFISKFDDLEERLKESLTLAHDIVTSHKSFNFLQNGEIYQVPYNEVLYIYRDSDKNCSIVVTQNKEVEVNLTIGKIEKQLQVDSRFMRVHRGCIVNVYNIEKFDINEGLITFKYQKQTDLISREHKKELKKRILKQEEVVGV